MSILDLTGIKGSTFEPIKPGKYTVLSQEAKIEDNFNKTGKKLSLKLRILGGEFDKRYVFCNFNIHNQSEQAQSIGRQQLKNFMESTKSGDVLNDVSELTNKTCVAFIKNETKDGKTYSRVSYFEEAGPEALMLNKDENIPF